MELLKELSLLIEAKESKEKPLALTDEVKEAKPHLNKISMMLFGQKAGPVVDEKRSKDPIFFGVSNARSKIMDERGKPIRLTFDNSTDSGEFEINSLTPLKIVQGGDLDKAIRALYKKHKVHSKKKTNYLDVDGDMVLREIHIGVSPDDAAVKLVRDVIKLIKGEHIDDEEEKTKKAEAEAEE